MREAGDLTLRPLRWWHLEEVLGIEAELFPSTPWTVEQFYGELAAAGRWMRVACDEQGRILGYLDVAVVGDQADLMTIAVASQFQRCGVGGWMLDAALTHAAGAGARQMTLEVQQGSPAVEFYQGAGFGTVARREGYYGAGVDALVMQRETRASTQGHPTAEESREVGR